MNESLPEFRSAVLARLIDRAPGKKLGRTQLMKLFYFLQELKGVPLWYDFRLFTYGPFDSEVLSDLATGCNLNMVKETTVIYSRSYGFEITLGPRADLIGLELDRCHLDVGTQIDAVVQEFGSFGAAELELRSTIHFVDCEFRRSDKPASSSGLAERVRQIKPHFSDSTILQRIKEMKEKGWLQSFVS